MHGGAAQCNAGLPQATQAVVGAADEGREEEDVGRAGAHDLGRLAAVHPGGDKAPVSHLTWRQAPVLTAAGCKDDSSSSAAPVQSRHPPGHTVSSPGEHAEVGVSRDELGSEEVLPHH